MHKQALDVKSQLVDLGWAVQKATGDGNCFFHALKQQLLDQGHAAGRETVHGLRLQVCAHLAANWETLISPMPEYSLAPDSEEPHEFLERMQRDRVPAEKPLLVAAGDLWGELECVMPRNAAMQSFRTGDPQSPYKLRIVFDGHGHFDGAVLTSEQSGELPVIALPLDPLDRPAIAAQPDAAEASRGPCLPLSGDLPDGCR